MTSNTLEHTPAGNETLHLSPEVNKATTAPKNSVDQIPVTLNLSPEQLGAIASVLGGSKLKAANDSNYSLAA